MDESQRHARPPRADDARRTSDPGTPRAAATPRDPAAPPHPRPHPNRAGSGGRAAGASSRRPDQAHDRPHDRQRGRDRHGGRPLRRRTLGELRPLVRAGRFRIARHAVRHAACEGFTERDIVGTVMHGRELMRYPEDERLLVLGWVPVSLQVKIPLHVVLEYSTPRWVDVVTAFIPDDPHRVVSRTRLAQWLRYDRAELEVLEVGRRWDER